MSNRNTLRQPDPDYRRTQHELRLLIDAGRQDGLRIRALMRVATERLNRPKGGKA
jgi:hypothetical protein